MNNLELYEKLRSVPEEAKKKITGGRLNGMTNISPMWRIKRMTEVFGVCGIGWKAEITDKRIEDGTDGQKVAVVDINLYIKQDGEWSDAIPGTGGSMLVANEKSGLHTSDEAFKMAYTDALGVAMKSLGLAADVYFSADAGFSEPTKYDTDDLASHSALAVGKRIEQLVTAKINNGMEYSDILSALNLNDKQFKTLMSYPQKLVNFEAAVRAL